ncbi:MAG: hypothetical protein QME58_07060 [Bacteroidota bacterium]|nr:hypothetical protein [Bacteroidota bacterium]
MLIKKSCRDVEKNNSPKYVGKGKITSNIFESYFRVIEEVLIEKFIGMDGEDTSLYELLKNHIPVLTDIEYKKEHRNILEYLLKQAKKDAVKLLKENISAN